MTNNKYNELLLDLYYHNARRLINFVINIDKYKNLNSTESELIIRDLTEISYTLRVANHFTILIHTAKMKETTKEKIREAQKKILEEIETFFKENFEVTVSF